MQNADTLQLITTLLHDDFNQFVGLCGGLQKLKKLFKNLNSYQFDFIWYVPRIK